MIKASDSRIISPLDFNLKDSTGDSCLSLAMSRGYYLDNELKDQKSFLQNRSDLLDLLLPRTSLSFCVKNKINTPMHWCVFNGDIVCGMKIFNERPMMLMESNKNGELPFDLFFKKEVRLHYYKSSIILMRKLIIGFSEVILKFMNAKPSEEKNFIKSSDSMVNKFYKFMKELKEVVKTNRERQEQNCNENEK